MRKRFGKLVSVLSILAMGAVPLHAGPILFINGSDVPNDLGTSFPDTVGGITAIFNGAAFDPGAFVTSTTSGTVSWGPEMLATNSTTSLVITFSQTLSSIMLDFGTITSAELDLVAFVGTSQVGASNATGTVAIPGDFFEGANLTFNAANFNKVVLSSSSSVIAVGNIQVTADAAPEPSTAIILGAGTILLLGGARRCATSRLESLVRIP